jgi:hypothetical protein
MRGAERRQCGKTHDTQPSSLNELFAAELVIALREACDFAGRF